ncbi:hypothetical protein OSB04_006444 [Centaurea solstitialis]|uniref:Uncharacterized protein n=1 Tax=Centaurea solstitialis TaxID=347529 RepID=A0AA38THY4_9ASTR|nr:hypothetical protein OSB04_006444 [Centaurea solstitialis]
MTACIIMHYMIIDDERINMKLCITEECTISITLLKLIKFQRYQLLLSAHQHWSSFKTGERKLQKLSTMAPELLLDQPHCFQQLSFAIYDSPTRNLIRQQSALHAVIDIEEGPVAEPGELSKPHEPALLLLLSDVQDSVLRYPGWHVRRVGIDTRNEQVWSQQVDLRLAAFYGKLVVRHSRERDCMTDIFLQYLCAISVVLWSEDRALEVSFCEGPVLQFTSRDTGAVHSDIKLQEQLMAMFVGAHSSYLGKATSDPLASMSGPVAHSLMHVRSPSSLVADVRDPEERTEDDGVVPVELDDSRSIGFWIGRVDCPWGFWSWELER